MSDRQYPSGFKVFLDGFQLPVTDVISAVLEDGIEMLDQLTVVLRNPQLTYIKRENFFRGRKITLEGGYHGKSWRTLFSGYVGKAEPAGDESGDTLTLVALPVDISKHWHVRRSYTLYEGLERHSDVVAAVLSRYHPEFRNNIEPSPPVPGVMIPIQNDETDIQFCKRMAREAGGFEFFIKGDTVFFRKPDTAGEPVITFKLGHNIKSYSFTEDDSIMAASVEYYTGGVAGNRTKPDTGSAKTSETRETTEGRAAEKKRASEPDNTNYILLAGMDPQLAEMVAKGKTAEPASLEQTLTLTATGDVRAVGGKNARVEGLGWIDGVWYMRNVTHPFDESGYTISVELSNHV